MRKATCSSRTAGAAFAHRRGGSRRGVLLLIVLSLLAMFALIGLTFVILTNHARRSAETAGRAEQYAKGPEDKAEMALMQCVRGTNNPASVLRNHSLLEDLYGYDPTVPFFTVNGFAPVTTGGQLVNVTITPGLTATLGNRLSVVGRVLTFTTGLARGKSTRVVGCVNDTMIQIVGVPDVAVNDQFVLNGVAFSGTGFGYIGNTAAAAGDPLLTADLIDPISGLSFPRALAPNLANLASGYVNDAVIGGANEDYDAADYQNMLLGLQLSTATTIGGINYPTGTTPIPSLHRPELVYYWFNQLLTNTPG
ncbi:MAG: hypothetical protein GX621_07910, partial [Pirellulaceae bacterium]|nr:hypothetical protein [Pirellulaceae bacterium]